MRCFTLASRFAKGIWRYVDRGLRGGDAERRARVVVPVPQQVRRLEDLRDVRRRRRALRARVERRSVEGGTVYTMTVADGTNAEHELGTKLLTAHRRSNGDWLFSKPGRVEVRS